MIQNKKIVYRENASWEEIQAFAEALNTNTLVAGVLLQRGIKAVDTAKEFLYGSKEPFGNPFLIKNMARAVTRIVEAMSKGEHITIYGDYDVDGITASSLLFLFLQERGAKVDVYIPRRDSEGYGLNSNALTVLRAKGTDLLITVDSGISGLEEVASRPVGMDIIITDHHMPPDELPAAYAIVNPHQPGDNYACKDLAGAGVSFKLCQALYQHLEQTEELWTKYIELAALGTIADLVPLLAENREIVRWGLKQLGETTNPGLQALIKVAGVADKPLTSETVGFVLAPRMNAAGRLDDAMDVVQLLTCGEPGKSAALAEKLNTENIERQTLSKDIYNEAVELLTAEPQPYAIVLGKDGWHSGVIGIVASRLVEKYACPVILLSFDGDRAKGSCRSIPPVNIYDTLGECREHLEQFGGHSQAAGLSLAVKDIPAFREAFQQAVKAVMQDEPYVPVVEPDYFVPLKQEVTVDTVKSLSLLEPYGRDNPAPIFAFKQAEVLNASAMGKEHNHLRLNLSCGGVKYKGISWNAGAMVPSFYQQEEATIAFAPKLNVFQGRESVDLLITAVEPQRRIIDYRTSFIPKEEILKNILQTEKKTVVYVSNTAKVNSQAGSCQVVTSLEELCQAEGNQYVLYDEAAAEVWQSEKFFLTGKTDSSLYLLYRREDFLPARQALKETYPNADVLRIRYKQLRQALHSGVLDTASLIAQVPGLTETALKIFQELGFIGLVGNRVEMQEAKFNPLTNSPTYAGLLTEYELKLKALNKCIDITSGQIAKNWK